MKEIITLQSNIAKENKKMRVAAYARVSVNSEPMLHSIDAQISYYNNLIHNTPDWEYVGIYADIGISGTIINKREAFQELMKQCEKGNVDIILCKSISRFARNTVDLLESVRHMKEIGVEIRFEREHISTSSKNGEFLLTLLASFAQEESRSISENIKWGMRKKYISGNAISWNKHVYGYLFDDNQKQYIIIPNEAEVVRKIFDMYLSGKSFHQIADNMNKRGITTTNGCKFDKGTIGRIVGNEIYTGDILWQKKYVESHLTRKKKTNKGELPMYLYQNCHEPIIEREIFERAKEIRNDRRKNYYRHIFGYRYDSESNSYFIIPEEAEAIKFIFEKFLERYNYSEIAKIATAHGIRTVRNNYFTRYSIGKLIRNKFYGISVTNEMTDDKKSCHKAIIDKKTFALVLTEQERRKNLQWKQF